MKLTNLIWVLALAGTLAACNSGPPITNEKPITPPPTGGSSGTGGISGDGACTTEENLAVYEALVYKDCDGVTHICEVGGCDYRFRLCPATQLVSEAVRDESGVARQVGGG